MDNFQQACLTNNFDLEGDCVYLKDLYAYYTSPMPPPKLLYELQIEKLRQLRAAGDRRVSSIGAMLYALSDYYVRKFVSDSQYSQMLTETHEMVYDAIFAANIL